MREGLWLRHQERRHSVSADPARQAADYRIWRGGQRAAPQERARFDELRSFDANGGARLGFEQTFPLLPTAGVAVDF